MKMTMNSMRAGLRRPASGTVLLCAVAAALVLARSSGARESGDAQLSPVATTAQDTATLNTFLTSVRGVDPVVCHLISRALENRWGANYGWLWSTAAGPDALGSAVLDWLNRSSYGRELMPRLRAALGEDDACVRGTSAHLLARVAVADLSVELRSELASTNAPTRAAAVIALGYFDRPSGFNDARRALDDADAGVRIAGVWALGMIESADAVPALSAAANNPDTRVRRMIAWSFGQIEAETAVPTLVRMLQDGEPTVRAQAAYALGQIESSDAIAPLVRVLETDRDPDVRKAAAAALGQISG